MVKEETKFVTLTVDELASIEGGFDPIAYGKYVIDEVVKGFRKGWN